MRRRLFPTLLLALSWGCAATESGGPGVDGERGPIGKADLIGSCFDACGGPAPGGNCWCDDLCADFGDCCGDKAAACDSEAGLCLADEHCEVGQVCDFSVCENGCPPGMLCADVCFGKCVEVSDDVLCVSGDPTACGDEQFCKFDDGSCGDSEGLGVCTDVGGACTKHLDPVCGCDGKTYANPCTADAAGVNMVHAGECEPKCCDPGSAPTCFVGSPACCEDGTWECVEPGEQPTCEASESCIACDDNSDCGAEELYCARQTCDGPGQCVARPENCITLVDPVCSCEGETISNACFAAAAGKNIAHDGACEGETCGDEGDSCADGEACCDGLQCCSGMPVPIGQEFCGQFCPISDRNKKEHFEAVDTAAILKKVSELEITTWNYTFDDAQTRHLGPMAQDFKAAFSVGATDKSIFTIDADGVALASIQALDHEVETLRADNGRLRQTLSEMRQRLDRLEAAR